MSRSSSSSSVRSRDRALQATPPPPAVALDWNNIDRVKFCCLCPSLLLATKAVFYPPDLIKTRLQVQTSRPGPFNFGYAGAGDAFRTILRHEGVRGLYRGFGVSNASVAVMQLYITTYEATKARLSGLHSTNTDEVGQLVVSSASGTFAAVVAQLVGTPCRVVLQNIQCGQGAMAPVAPAAATTTAAIGAWSKVARHVGVGAAVTPPGSSSSSYVHRHRHRPAATRGQLSTATAETGARTAPTPSLTSRWRNAWAQLKQYRRRRRRRRLRLQQARPTCQPSCSATAVVRGLVAQRGLAHLWTGFSGSVLMYAPTSAVWWALYPLFHHRTVKAVSSLFYDGGGGGGGGGGSVTPTPTTAAVLAKACAGSMAATVTCVVTQPLDVVRTRHHLLKSTSSSSSAAAASSVGGITGTSEMRASEVCAGLVREEGVRGLFRGLSMRTTKFCLSSFVMVCIYEGVKEQCRLA